MAQSKDTQRSARIVRWIARVWSLVLVVIVALILFLPDPNTTEPMPVEDWFLLSLWVVALLGLLVAWRWELVGGILALAALVVREVAWILVKGYWFSGFLLLWVAIVPPAILFLIAWRLDRGRRYA